MGRIVTKNNYEQYNSLEQLRKRDPEEKIHIQKLDKKRYVLKDATIAVSSLIELIEKNNWSERAKKNPITQNISIFIFSRIR
jgi:hypothetical protein